MIVVFLAENLDLKKSIRYKFESGNIISNPHTHATDHYVRKIRYFNKKLYETSDHLAN